MKIDYKNILKQLFSPKYFPPFSTILILLIGSLALFSLIADQQVHIGKENVVARIEPDTTAEAIISLEKDKDYVILDKQNGWLKVRVDAKAVGWIPEWYVTNDELTHDNALAAYFLVDTPVYSEPNVESHLLTTAEKETYAIIRYERDGWLQVEMDDHYGYIKTRSVNIINQENIPKIDLSKLDSNYDPEAIEQAKQAAEKIAVVRYSGEPLLDAPSTMANRIYDIAYGQKFKYIDEIAANDDSDMTFILVEDSEGLQGYIESRIVGMASDSIGHVTDVTATSIKDAIIMIDAGHGGDDSGALSNDESAMEKEVTLMTSLLLKEKLEAVGATVIMTRDTDRTVDLEERSRLSNEYQVDAFISIHFDASEIKELSGTTTYYFHEADFELSKAINNAISTLSLANNGSLFGNYSVLRENTRQAILLELGFMSNDKDLETILSKEYQDALTNVITTAFVEYFGQ